MQKSSNSDYDGQITQVVPIDIGKKGLDLRTNDDTQALTSLINARFTDSTSIERRTGYDVDILRDSSSFPNGQISVGNWVYGFGNTVVSNSLIAQHHPISSQNLATFTYDGNDISWTGDRLLIHTKDGSQRCLGGSTYWYNHNAALPTAGTSDLPYGIPCYLPSVVDINPPLKATAVSTEQNVHDICVTETQYCLVYTSSGSTYAQIINRDTNQLVLFTKLNSATTNNRDPRVVFSSGKFVAYWYDSTTAILYTASYAGISWTAQSNVVTSVASYDIETASFNGGYYLLYRTGPTLKARYYIGTFVQNSPFISDTTINVGGTTPDGNVAISLNPAGEVGIAWGAVTGTFAREFSPALTTKTGHTQVTFTSENAVTQTGLSIVSKGVPNNNGIYSWVVYIAYANVGSLEPGTRISSFASDGTTTSVDALNTFKYFCQPISRAFRVGNETFIWLVSGNSPVYFLVSGVYKPIVCGYSERGTAIQITRTKNLGGVCRDPLNSNKFLWVRSIANTATNANHLLYSTIDFLPQITNTQYGSSIYLSGSAVQNFDGTTVSDAGFQDYPITNFGVASAGGGLSAGDYRIRAYVVRYNNRGERFISPALTSAAVTAAGGQKISWDITFVQSCTATDATIEVYRTLAGGTTYFFEGTIANSGAGGTFITTLSDATIALNVGDPYQPQIGGLSELLENGPIGCTTIIAYNDRLWCSGGQVPAGKLVFSKIKITNFGAGFSALTGSVVIDSEQNPITSIAGINDTLAVFEKEKVFLLDTNGPDNFGRGNFSPIKFATKKGATTHFGTMLTDAGLVYWNEGGPYLLTGSASVINISDMVRPLAKDLTPTGVMLNSQKQEVVWFTTNGTALLWDYKSGNRWSLWIGLFINGTSQSALSTTNGKLYIPNSERYNDGGQTYTFGFKTSQLKGENLLSGYVLLKRYGIVGEFVGEHKLEFRTYYNGSPLWEEREVLSPDTSTYLTIAEDYGSLTAAQVDALQVSDKSGNYSFNKRAKRQNCQRFQLELLDNAPDGPSYFPLSLEFELGARPGLGRIASATVTDK